MSDQLWWRNRPLRRVGLVLLALVVCNWLINLLLTVLSLSFWQLLLLIGVVLIVFDLFLFDDTRLGVRLRQLGHHIIRWTMLGFRRLAKWINQLLSEPAKS